MTTTPKEDRLTPSEAAAYADCTKQTLYRWMQRGLRYHVMGNNRRWVHREDLDNWMDCGVIDNAGTTFGTETVKRP